MKRIVSLLLALAGCDVELVLLHADGGSISAADASVPDPPPLGTTTLAAQDSHTCAVRGGALFCWGEGGAGQLGTGDAMDSSMPLRVGAKTDWIAVTAGASHTCALDGAGDVYCFGANTAGQLGTGDTRDRATPERALVSGAARDVQSRTNHTCAILLSGGLECWGANAEGQLGLDDGFPATDRERPIAIASPGPWRVVATGQGHTCAIAASGHLFCWGRNTSDHLGLGSGADGQYRAPQKVGSDDDWASLSAGQEGTCALRRDHSLWCWGLFEGERNAVPTRVGSGSSWGQVQLDTFHLCALELGGALFCKGRGIEGQLGLGDNQPHDALTAIAPTIRFATVAVGRFYTCARKADGTVGCTGDNGRGQLGVGDLMRRASFTPTFPFP